MIGLEIITGTVSEHLESIRKMGFDYACDGIDPSKFKYQNEDEKEAFKKGYEEGLETMASIGSTEMPMSTGNEGRKM